MRIEGKQIDINDGDKSLIEDTLSLQSTIEKIFKQYIKEHSSAIQKEHHMWRKYEKIAIEQYPEFDPNQHVLSWNWERRELCIHSKDDRDEKLIGD